MYKKNLIMKQDDILNAKDLIKAGDIIAMKELHALKSFGWKSRPIVIVSDRIVDDDLDAKSKDSSYQAMMLTSAYTIGNSLPILYDKTVSFIDPSMILKVDARYDLEGIKRDSFGYARLTEQQLEMLKYLHISRLTGEYDSDIDNAIREYRKSYLKAMLSGKYDLRLNRSSDRILVGDEGLVKSYCGGVFKDDEDIVELLKKNVSVVADVSKSAASISTALDNMANEINAAVESTKPVVIKLKEEPKTDFAKALDKALKTASETKGKKTKLMSAAKKSSILARRPYLAQTISTGRIKIKDVKNMSDGEMSLFLTDVANAGSYVQAAKLFTVSVNTVNRRVSEVYNIMKNKDTKLPQKVVAFIENASDRRGYDKDRENALVMA